MKHAIWGFILLPFSIFCQNVGIGTTEPSEKLEVNGIIFTSQGGIKFPDGTIQTTAYVPGQAGMMQTGLSAIVMEFDPSSGIAGPAMDEKIQNGINVFSVSEGVARPASFEAGSGRTIGNPSFSDISFVRAADSNSPILRKLTFASNNVTIPYIEVFYLRISGPNGLYVIDHQVRYEECFLTSVAGSAGGFDRSESISFTFTKACYRAYKRDSQGVQTGIVDSCYKLDTASSTSSCTF